MPSLRSVPSSPPCLAWRAVTVLGVALAALAALTVGPAAADAAAARWSATQTFAAPDDTAVAIAADGRAVVASKRDSHGRLAVRTATASGRWSTPTALGRSSGVDIAAAAAPDGRALVAWVARDGVRVAARSRAGGRWRARLVIAEPGTAKITEIESVSAAADPLGGWVVAERAYPSKRSGQPYRLRAVSLSAGGTPGPVQDLGSGEFGLGRGPTAALAVGDDGVAHLVATVETAAADPAPAHGILAFARPHGGSFGAATGLGAPAAADARVTTGPGGAYAVGWTETVRRGDAGAFGPPALATGTGAAAPGTPQSPRVDVPGREFDPSVAFAGTTPVLVWSQRTHAAPFSPLAAVRSAVTTPTGLIARARVVTQEEAIQPVGVSVGRRALVGWATRRHGVGLRFVEADGHRSGVARPVGAAAPLDIFRTAFDLRAAGRAVILAWLQRGTLHVATRRF